MKYSILQGTNTILKLTMGKPEFWPKKYSNAKGDSIKFYSLVSVLTGTKSENLIPSESDTVLAEKLFINKNDKIRN